MGLKLVVDHSLELCELDLEDADVLYSLVEKNRNYLRQFLSWVDYYKTLDDAKKFIHHSLQQQQSGEALVLCIKEGGQLVGVVGFVRIDALNKYAELGYWLDQSKQGKGIMKRSIERLSQYAFKELDLNRLEARCAVDNTPSENVLKRSGFQEEAILRKATWSHDRFTDAKLYSQLRQEA